MNKYKSLTSLGLMSGTSLDGLDLVVSNFSYTNKWQYRICAAETIPYPPCISEQLKKAHNLPANELLKLDLDYGLWLGKQINLFLEKVKQKVDFISSHGHTVFHQPQNGYTLQIGDLQTIANTTQIATIGDFRQMDINLGGQGAPLVPIGDQLLFANHPICLNLGGIMNISHLHEDRMIAYDIGAFNLIFNYFAQQKGMEYDKNGDLTAQGNLHLELYQALQQLDFYKILPPKSTGREWVESVLVPLLEGFSISIEDKMYTFCQHMVEQLSVVIENIALNNKVLITGGGAFHQFFIDELKKKVNANVEIVIPEPALIMFKEAIVFAFLGVLKKLNLPNCLASVTGAKENHSSGRIYEPQK